MTAAISAGVGAGVALASGSAAAVAAVGGTLAAVASVVAGTLVAVSLVMTVVGLATGDSKLMKIGGYVGLAGGVAGLAAGAAGAGASAASEGAMSAVPAASDAATASAAGGLGNAATQAGKAAITPALSNVAQSAITPVAQAATTTGNQALVQAGTQGLGQAGTQAIESAVTPTMEAGLGSNIGTNVGTNLAKTGVENQTGFFSFMDSPGFKGGLELAKLGGSVIGNMANGSMNEDFMNEKLDLQGKELGLIGERNAQTAAFNNAQLAQTQQQQDYNQMVEERKYQNANTQGRGILTTRVLSAEERLAASRAKAQQAASNAQILTGAA
jgi:hypothetical protein